MNPGGKKIAFGAHRPVAAAPAPDPEAWIRDRRGMDPEAAPAQPAPAPEAPKEPTKRLTFDIPRSLHAAVKATCATEGKKMNEEIIKLLEARFRPAQDS